LSGLCICGKGDRDSGEEHGDASVGSRVLIVNMSC
jgi:hypothetical protein